MKRPAFSFELTMLEEFSSPALLSLMWFGFFKCRHWPRRDLEMRRPLDRVCSICWSHGVEATLETNVALNWVHRQVNAQILL